MTPLFLYQKLLDKRLNEEELKLVESWMEEHPYFTLPYYLKARHAKDRDTLFKASLHSPNRSLLKRYMDGSVILHNKDDQFVWDKSVDMNQKRYPYADNTTFSILKPFQPANSKDTEIPFHILKIRNPYIDSFLTYEVKTRTIRYLPLVKKIEQQIKKYQQQGSQWDIGEKSNGVHSTNFFEEVNQEEDHHNDPKDVALQEKIIDEFLAQQPKITPLKPNQTVKPDQTASASLEPDQDIVSETLAKLHLKQHNPKEAIRIYQKLSLLFPEKSAYFESQIRKINQL